MYAKRFFGLRTSSRYNEAIIFFTRSCRAAAGNLTMCGRRIAPACSRATGAAPIVSVSLGRAAVSGGAEGECGSGPYSPKSGDEEFTRPPRSTRRRPGFLSRSQHTGPPLVLARVLLYGYVVTRFLHFTAYLRAWNHETRATWWSIGSIILVIMSIWVLWAVLH